MPPGCFETQIEIGLLEQKRGDWQAALASFQETARLFPTRAPVYLLMGDARGRLGNWADAIENYEKAILADPRYADAYNNLGIAFLEVGRDQKAIAAYAKAIELNPHHANAFFNFGKLLARLNQFEIATELFEKALELQPLHAYAYHELGIVQEKSGLLAKASHSYRRSMELDPTRTVRANLAAVLTLMGDPVGIQQLEQLVLEQPLDAEAHWNLGTGLLRHGKWEAGWREFEWRTEIPRFRTHHHRFQQPRWQGEPLHGKTILLYGEQGHGDTLQFLRYVPLVAERGGRVLLEVPPLLCSLVEGTPGVAECLPRGKATQDVSTYASLMSLPHLLGVYEMPLPIAPIAQNSETHPPHCDELKVGLAWAGNPGHEGDRLRSIPLIHWKSLSQIEDVRFTSLQMGPVSSHGLTSENPFRFAEDCADLQDFASLAAVVSKLDLVITVDTAVAHLAGSMGKPVWILLSNASDWRWGLNGNSTGWYPSARLFRQTTPGDWSQVMATIVQQLRRHRLETESLSVQNSSPSCPIG